MHIWKKITGWRAVGFGLAALTALFLGVFFARHLSAVRRLVAPIQRWLDPRVYQRPPAFTGSAARGSVRLTGVLSRAGPGEVIGFSLSGAGWSLPVDVSRIPTQILRQHENTVVSVVGDLRRGEYFQKAFPLGSLDTIQASRVELSVLFAASLSP